MICESLNWGGPRYHSCCLICTFSCFCQISGNIGTNKQTARKQLSKIVNNRARSQFRTVFVFSIRQINWTFQQSPDGRIPLALAIPMSMQIAAESEVARASVYFPPKIAYVKEKYEEGERGVRVLWQNGSYVFCSNGRLDRSTDLLTLLSHPGIWIVSLFTTTKCDRKKSNGPQVFMALLRRIDNHPATLRSPFSASLIALLLRIIPSPPFRNYQAINNWLSTRQER